MTEGEGEVKDWCRIAEHLPGRTNKDCRKRWHNSVAGGLKKGQWSKSEDLQLARGVQRFGQRYTHDPISSFVPLEAITKNFYRWTLVANTVQSRSADRELFPPASTGNPLTGKQSVQNAGSNLLIRILIVQSGVNTRYVRLR